MAYETGTAADINELINVRLKNFMVAEGWTLNSDAWPAFLALSDDGCFINFRWDQAISTNQQMQDNGIQNVIDAFGVARTDHKLWAHLSSGFNGANGWDDQPDSTVTAGTGGDVAVQVTDLLGPYPSYHIFSGAPGDPKYIYMAIETRAGYYSHLCFGNVEKTGLSYPSPNAAFLTGSRYAWWPDASRNDTFWDSNLHRHPFQANNFARPQYHVHAGGADPGTLVRPTPSNNRANMRMILPLGSSALRNPDPVDWDTTNGEANGVLHNANLFRGRLGVSGVTPLHPVPIMTPTIAQDGIYYYLGEAKNLRICSMFDLIAGQRIAFGEDEWLVFPARRAQNKGRLDAGDINPSPELTATTFQYGLAYKLVA